MKWTEFVNAHELNPVGERLFHKVLHDVSGCVVPCQSCPELLPFIEAELPADTLNWFAKWKSTFEAWVSRLISLKNQRFEFPGTSPEWANLIANIGDVVAEAPIIKKESETLSQPTEAISEDMDILNMVIRSVAALAVILDDIQAQEYERLWTIKYQDTIH